MLNASIILNAKIFSENICCYNLYYPYLIYDHYFINYWLSVNSLNVNIYLLILTEFKIFDE